MEAVNPANGGRVPEQRASEAPHRSLLCGDLARDTNGQLQPRYEYSALPARRLVSGDFVDEPVLGAVAVETITACAPFIQIRWVDGGPCAATARYADGERLAVRGPAPAERRLLQQGVDRAAYLQKDIGAPVARLLAAHLHRGPGSGLYRFAVDGALSDGLFDELDQIVRRGRPDRRAWASALARYCVDREEPGPVPGWAPQPKKPVKREFASAAVSLPQVDGRSVGSALRPALLGDTYIRAETALRLLDAAYALGAAACRSPQLAMAARRYRYLTRNSLPWGYERVPDG
jgi:hypothetical protein